ncbi:MAG: coenzyme F420-0:L-glutamate ligase [Gammaproteobacteria bacterium]|nr:coenzyme F420-0:L-glutamate ligase [Gammaproteobacteria bacterium]
MPTPALSLYPVPGLPLIEAGCDLAALIIEHTQAANLTPEPGDVFVIAQKIVSKAENCFVDLRDIEPSHEARLLAYSSEKDPRIAELILRQSRAIVRDTPTVLITEHKLGIVLANAGIDRSNVDGHEDIVLTLPENPDQSARELQTRLQDAFGVKLGVVITDSVGRPWRMGTTGLAIGCAGTRVLDDRRGRVDLFGRVLQVAEVGTADCVASAAGLLMGEGDESTPVVLIRGLETGDFDQPATDIIRPEAENLFK